MDVESNVKKSSKQIGASFLFYQLFLFLFSIVVIPMLAMSGNVNAANGLGASIVKVLAIVVVVIMYKKRLEISIPHEYKDFNYRWIIKACALFIAINYMLHAGFRGLNNLLSMVGYQFQYAFSYLPWENTEEVFYIVLDTVLIAPIVEEIYYRGIILNGLKRHGEIFALVASAVVFGLAHGSLPNAITYFVSSFVLGYLFLKTNSIIPCIIVHMVNNCMAVLQSYSLNHMILFLIFLIMILVAVIYTLFYLYKHIGAIKHYIEQHQETSVMNFFKNWQVMVVCALCIISMLPIIVKL